MRRRYALLLVALAALLPRMIVSLVEGSSLFSRTEKSDRFAQVFVSSGTFGQIPGIPSAYTQPLYSFLLIPIYWVDRSWWLVTGTQIVVAMATAITVYFIGLRIGDPRTGLAAALISTLHPYLVWHDVHSNREIVDQLAGALLVLAAVACAQRPTRIRGLLLGFAIGAAMLGNSRLSALPLVLGSFLIVTRRREALIPVALMVVGVTLVVLPWVVRNDRNVGCPTITTDARALWKANNTATLGVLRAGLWIDQVPDIPGAPPTPQDAANAYISRGKIIAVDECAQMRLYQHQTIKFWTEHPDTKAKLAAVALRHMWSPVVGPASEWSSTTGTTGRLLAKVSVPLWFITLVGLAIAGARFVPRMFLALTLTLLGYETLMAMVFTGATRYRVAWEFLLALLAAPALVRLLDLLRKAR